MSSVASLRVVIYQDGEHWIAQALEHDICVQGRDHRQLRARFVATVKAELEHALSLGDVPLGRIEAAPQRFFEMWDRQRSDLFPPNDAPSDDGIDARYALVA